LRNFFLAKINIYIAVENIIIVQRMLLRLPESLLPFSNKENCALPYKTPELVFAEQILQILYWIFEIAIHSCVIVDLPTDINM
jgi:hypothetical protein